MEKPKYEKPTMRELPLQGAFTIGTYGVNDQTTQALAGKRVYPNLR